MAFLGLEIAHSIVKFNTLKEYWSTDEFFLGNDTFKGVIGRKKYEAIRVSLILYPANICNDKKDPLYTCRTVILSFTTDFKTRSCTCRGCIFQ